jgi:hypothetical protein
LAQEQPVSCRACGAGVSEEALFCGRCGARLDEALATPERRIVTALFCDLVGSTELAERTDPEEVDRLLRRYHGLAREAIERHGGTIEKFIGDAVAALFGFPLAHEDDPGRAVRAALDIVERVRSDEISVQVRVAVETGEAFVRDVAGGPRVRRGRRDEHGGTSAVRCRADVGHRRPASARVCRWRVRVRRDAAAAPDGKARARARLAGGQAPRRFRLAGPQYPAGRPGGRAG